MADLKIYEPQHKLINNGGMILWLPRSCFQGSLKSPDIYAQSALQEYPLGACLDFADGRRFRYGKIGATTTGAPIARMLVNYNFVPGSDDVDGYEGSLDAVSNYAVGSRKLVINDPEDRAENHYEDGMLSVFPSGHYVEYRLAGSEAATSVDDVTIYLEDPNGLQTALVVNSTGVTAYPSIFSNMRQSSGAYESAVGVCLADTCTADYFVWVQRRGRAIVTPTAYYGDTANERMGQLHYPDGTQALKAADATHTIGYLTQRTVSGYGDLEVWLQLE